MKVQGCKEKLPSMFEECKLESENVVNVVKNNFFQQEDITYGKKGGRALTSGELSQRSFVFNEKPSLPTPPVEEAEEENFSELEKKQLDARDLELFKNFKVTDI